MIVKRFDMHGSSHINGEYVSYSDCAKLESQLAALKEENERLKAEKVQINGKLAGSRLAVSRLEARVAELTAPDVQGEPVAALLISEPEYTKQGWEPGDWDIEPNATTIEAFAKLAKPGAYQLYLAPQPAEQKPDVDSGLPARGMTSIRYGRSERVSHDEPFYPPATYDSWPLIRLIRR